MIYIVSIDHNERWRVSEHLYYVTEFWNKLIYGNKRIMNQIRVQTKPAKLTVARMNLQKHNRMS